MIQMKAKRAMIYAGRRMQAGEAFEVQGLSHARLLGAIGHAEVHTADAKVEESEAVEPEAVEPEEIEKPKRHYRRRDLTAE